MTPKTKSDKPTPDRKTMTDREAGQWVPLHKGHAIEQFVFTLQFAGAIAQPLIRTLREQLKNDDAFPGKSDLRAVGFQIGAGAGGLGLASGVLPASGAPVLAGLQYQKARPDGIVETELRLETSSMVFRTITYTHWGEIWAAVKKYIDISLPIYVKSAKLAVIGLSYVDKFVWQGALESSNPFPILQPGSKYLVQRVYASRDLWHTHSGEFVRVDSQTKRLVNVDVDYVDEYPSDEPRRALVVKTVLNDNFNQPGYEQTSLTPQTGSDFVGTHVNQLHDLSKDILASIISSEMAKRIALGG